MKNLTSDNDENTQEDTPEDTPRLYLQGSMKTDVGFGSRYKSGQYAYYAVHN